MSIGNEPLVISFENGLNLITGYNQDDPGSKNGIGKSTICDALFFALFGETIKKLKVAEIVNDKNCEKCEVELEFNIDNGVEVTDYKILRGIKPSKALRLQILWNSRLPLELLTLQLRLYLNSRKRT